MSQTSITSWLKAAVSPTSTAAPAAPRPPACSPPPPAPPPPAPSTYAAPPSTTTAAAAAATAPVQIHPNAVLRPITPADIPAVRRVLSLMLAVHYGDAFYKPLAAGPAGPARHSRLITWSDPATPARQPAVVGVLVCRVEPRPAAPALYLQALCLLSPYHGLGLMSAALDAAVRAAALHDAVRVVDAHVWTASHDALAWYARRGFARSPAPVDGYYLKLEPATAWIVSRPVEPETGADEASRPVSVVAAAAQLTPFPSSAASSSATSLSSVPPPPPPPPKSLQAPPPGPPRGQSFQNTAPATSWNDLPDDMAASSRSGPQTKPATGGRKKRDRSYPVPTY
ncbi:hypothetical protein BROUX41_003607 [Berkeleyomyces rouxiae]|uniref:uncharacterized protein n=1 Tax=Berkeleyomyces rouxiae TaxID=2035830 RepID=UPI003B7862B6